MCASQKVGIIAGGGDLPARLGEALSHQGYEPVIGRLGADFSVGQAGKIISFFKSQHVSRLVLVGSLSRPNWWTVRADFRGLKIISKLILKSVGDDALLKVIRRELESEGFEICGVHEFMPELLCPAGVLGSFQPDKNAEQAIVHGIRAAKQHGQDDLGQAVVVDARSGKVIAKETCSGTDALIRSVRESDVPKILVKMSKPQQDMALDMPTIGTRTIEEARKSGFIGIVAEAGATLVPEQDKIIDLCNRYEIFFKGVSADDI
ncbi:MAG: hypothetical protein AUJ12_05615 [Alphaproteobacteria bacterium CG1_02_46_17]|nr:MAG: hypothetical protein AUJ12_05615 [Alphaproteobacteria bacterium CG1_02_46_17]